MKNGDRLYIRVDFCDFNKQNRKYLGFSSPRNRGGFESRVSKSVYKKYIIKINTYYDIIVQMTTIVHEIVHFIFNYYKFRNKNKYTLKKGKENKKGEILRLPKGLKEESVCLKIDRYAKEVFIKYFVKGRK